jgi:sec-independent protein translocase protein TatC
MTDATDTEKKTEDDGDTAPGDKKMPLLEHLVELRNRLMYACGALLIAFLACYYFSDKIYLFLTQPLVRAYTILDQVRGATGADPLAGRRMIFTAPQEAFITYLKVAFFAGAFISFPIIASQLWMFVAPGLYKNEKRAFLPFLAATPILFFMGGALVYYVVAPFAFTFFLSFQTGGGEGVLPIELETRVGEYLSLIMQFIFAFGLCFQLPVLLTLLVRVGILSSEQLASKRRYAIVGAFIVAAVLTPPDVLSQISLALPIVLLYEISIWCSKLVERKRAQREAEEAAKEAEEEAKTAASG